MKKIQIWLASIDQRPLKSLEHALSPSNHCLRSSFWCHTVTSSMMCSTSSGGTFLREANMTWLWVVFSRFRLGGTQGMFLNFLFVSHCCVSLSISNWRNCMRLWSMMSSLKYIRTRLLEWVFSPFFPSLQCHAQIDIETLQTGFAIKQKMHKELSPSPMYQFE